MSEVDVTTTAIEEEEPCICIQIVCHQKIVDDTVVRGARLRANGEWLPSDLLCSKKSSAEREQVEEVYEVLMQIYGEDGLIPNHLGSAVCRFGPHHITCESSSSPSEVILRDNDRLHLPVTSYSSSSDASHDLPDERDGETIDFVWLVQHVSYMDLSAMRGPNSDAILIVWKNKPSPNEMRRGGVIWKPQCTPTEGRNELLTAALARQNMNFPKNQYLYFIYRDGDTVMEERADYGLNTGHPPRTFERYLKIYEPAVGVGWYPLFQTLDKAKEVDTVYHFDFVTVAFHFETLGVLLPFSLRWQHENWLHCQRATVVMASALYAPHVLQFNAIAMTNRNSSDYPREGWIEKPLSFLMGAMRHPSQLERIHLDWRDQSIGRIPTVEKKDGKTYTVAITDVNPCHPYFRENPLFQTIYPKLHGPATRGLCEMDVDEGTLLVANYAQIVSDKTKEIEREVKSERKRVDERMEGLEEKVKEYEVTLKQMQETIKEQQGVIERLLKMREREL